MTEKISIITVTFNADKLIKRTIESVAGQRYSNIEFIIIDGFSTDRTVEVIKENNYRIDKWITEKDKGLYDAMNKGIKISSGEWLFFMNAGDTFFSNETLSEFMEHNACDIIYGDNYIVNSIFQPVRYLKSGALNKKTIRKGMPVSHQSVFVRREICPFYDIRFKLKAEYNWFIDMLDKVDDNKIIYRNEAVINYPLGGLGQRRYWENFKEYQIVVQKRFGLIQNIRNMPHDLYTILNYLLRKIFKVDSLRFWIK